MISVTDYIPRGCPPEWGNVNVQFNESHASGKLNFATQAAVKSHRGGWLQVLQSMSGLHNSSGVRCETFVESLFDWRRFDSEKNNIIPIKVPWVGFIHNPVNIPEWYGANWTGIGDQLFSESLESCIGMYTMSEYHADQLREHFPNMTFESILHPYDNDTEFKAWNQNSKQIVSVGWWLRKQASLYRLTLPDGWKKIKLWTYSQGSQPQQLVQERLFKECDAIGIPRIDVTTHDVNNLYRIPDKEYDELLCNSVVFLDLWDTSANNTILECIQRQVPIIVKNHPAVREYLGDQYPLYFNELEEVHDLLSHVQQAHEYLTKLKKTNKYTTNTFINNLKSSGIYRKI